MADARPGVVDLLALPAAVDLPTDAPAEGGAPRVRKGPTEEEGVAEAGEAAAPWFVAHSVVVVVAPPPAAMAFYLTKLPK